MRTLRTSTTALLVFGASLAGCQNGSTKSERKSADTDSKFATLYFLNMVPNAQSTEDQYFQCLYILNTDMNLASQTGGDKNIDTFLKNPNNIRLVTQAPALAAAVKRAQGDIAQYVQANGQNISLQYAKNFNDKTVPKVTADMVSAAFQMAVRDTPAQLQAAYACPSPQTVAQALMVQAQNQVVGCVTAIQSPAAASLELVTITAEEGKAALKGLDWLFKAVENVGKAASAPIKAVKNIRQKIQVAKELRGANPNSTLEGYKTLRDLDYAGETASSVQKTAKGAATAEKAVHSAVNTEKAAANAVSSEGVTKLKSVEYTEDLDIVLKDKGESLLPGEWVSERKLLDREVQVRFNTKEVRGLDGKLTNTRTVEGVVKTETDTYLTIERKLGNNAVENVTVYKRDIPNKLGQVNVGTAENPIFGAAGVKVAPRIGGTSRVSGVSTAGKATEAAAAEASTVVHTTEEAAKGVAGSTATTVSDADKAVNGWLQNIKSMPDKVLTPVRKVVVRSIYVGALFGGGYAASQYINGQKQNAASGTPDPNQPAAAPESAFLTTTSESVASASNPSNPAAANAVDPNCPTAQSAQQPASGGH